MPGIAVDVKVNSHARKAVRDAAGDLVRRVVRGVAAEIRRVISRRYPPASAPGEPPALRSGDLRDSVRDHFDEATQTGTVSIGAECAGYLEKGTRRMKRRPFALATARDILARFARGHFTSTRRTTG